jgi:carboxypeptidase D
MCPIPFDSLGNPGSFIDVPENFTVYFQLPDVMAAIHAPPNVTWNECANDPVFIGDGGPQGAGDSSPDPIQGVLPKVIEKTHKVLVTNGDYGKGNAYCPHLLTID